MKSLTLLTLVGAAVATAAIQGPVKTESGQVEGVAGKNPEITVYKGIPFAAPPVGDLRWKPPQPPARWQGVKMADTFGSQCVQGGAGGGGARGGGGAKGGAPGGGAPKAGPAGGDAAPNAGAAKGGAPKGG